MGKVVKAVTKPFKSVAKAVQKAVGGVVSAVTGQPKQAAPQVITNEVAAPQAVAQPLVNQPQATGPDETSGESSERTNRKGKRSLTIRRTNVGGGSGLNV